MDATRLNSKRQVRLHWPARPGRVVAEATEQKEQITFCPPRFLIPEISPRRLPEATFIPSPRGGQRMTRDGKKKKKKHSSLQSCEIPSPLIVTPNITAPPVQVRKLNRLSHNAGDGISVKICHTHTHARRGCSRVQLQDRRDLRRSRLTSAQATRCFCWESPLRFRRIIV